MRRFIFKSIYAKFTLVFLGIWWLLNSLTFGVIIKVMSNSPLAKLSLERSAPLDEFNRIKTITGLTFLISAMVGTPIIILVVRGIVKPIKQLSSASREVASGNFDIQVEIKNDDEIGQLTVDFNSMTKELKHIDLLRKDFVSNVSHEFKTPITSIKGFAKLIRDQQLSADQLLEYSQIIVNESERLSLLSTNLLQLSELDNQIIRKQGSVFSLDEQIRKSILLLEVQWTKKELELEIDLEEVSYNGYEHLLEQVWLNLLQNAIKFSKPKGIIRIGLHKKDAMIKVDIEDNGAGIAEGDKDRIFERFYKGDKSRSKEGNGLGLVIVKNILELSNGKIYFESQQGKGTIFSVELPI